MRKKAQVTTRVLLGIIIFLLLILLFFFLFSQGLIKTRTSSNAVASNSQPAQQVRQQVCENVQVPYYTDRYDSYYYDDYYYQDYRTDTLRFSSYKREKTVEGIFGNDIDKYIVRVKNTDRVGGYFTVDFKFYDKYGDKTTRRLIRYIEDGEVEEFVYQDIYGDRDEHYRWEYEVSSDKKSALNYDYYQDSYDPYYRTRPTTRYRTERRCFWV